MLDNTDKEKLFKAAECNDIETVKLFVEEKNVPATITNDQGQTLAHTASKHGNLGIVKYILEKNSTILSVLDNEDYSILHLAVKNGNIDVVKYLVEEQNAEICRRNRRDLARTAIHTAVQFGHLNLLKYFIDERNVDVDMPGEWQDKPPVFLALQYRHPDILEYLIEEKKADLNAVDFFGENILYIAVKIGDLDFMKRILDKKSLKFDVDRKNRNEETLVFKAVTLNQTDIIKYLVDIKHADVNIPEKWNHTTCLHVAAAQNDFKLCKYLIAHGANTYFKDISGQIPVQKATNESLIEYMRSISRKMKRNRRSIVYSTFQPIVMKPYECVLHGSGGGCSKEMGHFNENSDVSAHGNIFQSIFFAIAESLSTSLANRIGHQSLLGPQAIIQNRIDPIAENVITDTSGFEKS